MIPEPGGRGRSQIWSMNELPHINQMQGTPQPYLPSVVPILWVASTDV